MSHHHDNGEIHEHDRGLDYDLPRLISRRKALGVFGGAMAVTALAACGSANDGGGATSTATTGATSTGSTSASSEIPEETTGPYPGDGSNGPNVLTESGVVRSDITKSIGDASGVAEGVPTSVEMKLLDVAAGGTALAGAAVYLWHCDAAGRYSLYEETCDAVYATAGYEQSVQNMTQLSLETDMVFADGYASQLATVSGSVDDGFAVKLNVGV